MFKLILTQSNLDIINMLLKNIFNICNKICAFNETVEKTSNVNLIEML